MWPSFPSSRPSSWAEMGSKGGGGGGGTSNPPPNPHHHPLHNQQQHKSDGKPVPATTNTTTTTTTTTTSTTNTNTTPASDSDPSKLTPACRADVRSLGPDCAPPKRARKGRPDSSASSQLPLPLPSCQVEGCDADLSSAKDYHRRHKVCQAHSKSAKVMVAGIGQRFCQQCSRFHVLMEFDESKRSCRRRLAGHNERRRKPKADPLAMRFSAFQGPGGSL